jgi:hypothetical protein
MGKAKRTGAPIRTGAMQDLGYEFPRMPLPRRWVNKLSEAAPPRSLARHRSLYRARKAPLKVQDAHLPSFSFFVALVISFVAYYALMKIWILRRYPQSEVAAEKTIPANDRANV